MAQQLVQKFVAAQAAGSAPDALSLDLIYTPAFAAAGQLQDVTDWAHALPYFAKLSPAVRNGMCGTVDWGAVQAGITVMMLPCLVIFLLLQRYCIRGLTVGAVK